MKSPTQYIRLSVATAASLVSVFFAASYSYVMVCILRKFHRDDDWLPGCTKFLLQYGWAALFVPISLLALGILVQRRSGNRALFELIVGCQWLFTVFWFAYAILAWKLPEVPVY